MTTEKLKQVRDALRITLLTAKFGTPEELGEFAYGYMQGIINDLQKQLATLDSLIAEADARPDVGAALPLHETDPINFLNGELEKMKHPFWKMSIDEAYQYILKLEALTAQQQLSGVNTRPTPQIDVEALKLKVTEIIEKQYGECVRARSKTAIEYIIDYLAANGYLRAPLPRIEGLEDDLKNSVTVNTDNTYMVEQSVLDAARAYAKLQGSKNDR